MPRRSGFTQHFRRQGPRHRPPEAQALPVQQFDRGARGRIGAIDPGREIADNAFIDIELPVGAIVGEWIGSVTGIGALIIQAMYAFDSAMLYATVVVGSTFSVCFFLLISMIERLMVRWQPPVLH